MTLPVYIVGADVTPPPDAIVDCFEIPDTPTPDLIIAALSAALHTVLTD